jgi:hypothetical protein
MQEMFYKGLFWLCDTANEPIAIDKQLLLEPKLFE